MATLREESADTSVIPNLFPITNMSKQMDSVTPRYAWPRGIDRTEAHWTYFARVSADEELLTHRIRQTANLVGPSGWINLADGAVFNRLRAAAGTGDENYFIKGVHRHGAPLNDSTRKR